MKLQNALVTIACLALLPLAGCGDDQTVDPGTNQNPAEAGSDAAGPVVIVSYQGQSYPISLASVATTAYKGVNLVRLSDVWAATKVSVDPSTLAFEFVSSDGFKPSKKGCADLSGTLLAQGYIDPASRNLTWDEALGFEGCYSVRDTAQMNAHEPVAGTDAGETDAPAE